MDSFSPEFRRIMRHYHIVAFLFLISGCYHAIEMLIAPFFNKITIQLGVLGIPIFFGLMKFRPGWRTCALVLLWLGLIFIPVFALLPLFSNAPAYLNILGIRIMRIPSFLLTLAATPFFLLAWWQYRVLTDPRIKQIFNRALRS